MVMSKFYMHMPTHTCMLSSCVYAYTHTCSEEGKKKKKRDHERQVSLGMELRLWQVFLPTEPFHQSLKHVPFNMSTLFPLGYI